MQAWLVRSIPVLALLAFGCDSADQAKTESKTEYTCEITVAAKAGDPEKFSGNFQGPDEEASKEKAWEAVCASLPEADQPDCRDDSKFAVATSAMTATMDGAPSHSTTITLTRVVAPEQFEAEVTSTESEDAACAEALAKACKAGGAAGDCVAAGTHEQRGLKASKKG